MIAAAIVCAAVVSQAATIQWGFGLDALTPDGKVVTDLNGYDIVLAVQTDGGWEKVQAGTWDMDTEEGESWATVGGSYVAANTVMAGNSYTMLLEDADGNLSKVELAGGGTFDTVLAVEDDIPSNWKDTKTLNYSGDNPVIPVPEPTSGLLLLLGVAGMALRRRRA